MKKFLILFMVLWSLLPVSKIFAQKSVAGFVPGNIWYSKDPFEEGDRVQIYTMLFNPDTREFSGTVIFFDNSTFLGKKDFKLASKEANDFFINWTATAGDHKIYAKIENAKFLVSTGKYEDYYTAGNQTQESTRSVSKKIVAKNGTSSSGSSVSVAIPDISKIIEEKTPDSIAKPIIATADGIEGLRQDITDNSKENITELKKNLADNTVATKNTKAKETVNTSMVLKPWNYVKLFFFYLVSFIFGNKIIFYGLLVLIVFFILRFIWHKVF